MEMYVAGIPMGTNCDPLLANLHIFTINNSSKRIIIKLNEMTKSNTECNFFDFFLFNDDGEFKCRVYDKRDDFNFDIVNYPFMYSNTPIGPAYGVYVLWLIAFSRICTDVLDLSERHKLLVCKLIKQGFTRVKLKEVFEQFRMDIGMWS